MINLIEALKNRISICIWGEWLGGRIGENTYLLVKEERKSDNIVVLYFDNNEKCIIINPRKMIWKGKVLSVKSADKVIWEFYYYGRPQIAENLFTLEYSLLDKSRVRVVAKSKDGNRDEIIKVRGKAAISSF